MARLQREVARSKSEGTMVKYSGAALPCNLHKAKTATVCSLLTHTHTLSFCQAVTSAKVNLWCFNTSSVDLKGEVRADAGIFQPRVRKTNTTQSRRRGRKDTGKQQVFTFTGRLCNITALPHCITLATSWNRLTLCFSRLCEKREQNPHLYVDLFSARPRKLKHVMEPGSADCSLRAEALTTGPAARPAPQ